MLVDLIFSLNDVVIKIYIQASRIESYVKSYPDIKFYSINHKSPHKEWIIYTVQGGKVVSYPALFKPVKLLTYLLLTDV